MASDRLPQGRFLRFCVLLIRRCDRHGMAVQSAAGAVGFLAVYLLYALSQDVRRPWKDLWPGVLLSLAAWMLLSWLYACYADRFAHYSLLYGSIGAVIVVLIWLELSAVTLILGAEVNGVLIRMRKDERHSEFS